jgi:hypothetical protein
MKTNNKKFKSHDKTSFVTIHIQEIETPVKITCDNREGLIFMIEFNFKGKQFTQVFEKVSTKEKTFNSDEISFIEMELHPIDKKRIAYCLNQELDLYFS